MQKARIRTSWKDKNRDISLVEFANALSAICWRISLNAAKNLHDKDFIYDNDNQRIGVIRAYLVFFVHCTDRLLYDALDEDQRLEFMTALSKDCFRHYDENHAAILQQRADQGVFFASLNNTFEILSACHFVEDNPAFDMYRALADVVQTFMGHDQMNKWVQAQVMEIDGPNAYDIFFASFKKLRRSAGF